MSEQPVMDRAVKALSGHIYQRTDEATLQTRVGTVLARAGLDPTAEVRLNTRDRVDFLCGTVAVEVKVKGTAVQAFTQCQRYARTPFVTAVVLATTQRAHMEALHEVTALCEGRVPFTVVHLPGVWSG